MRRRTPIQPASPLTGTVVVSLAVNPFIRLAVLRSGLRCHPLRPQPTLLTTRQFMIRLRHILVHQRRKLLLTGNCYIPLRTNLLNTIRFENRQIHIMNTNRKLKIGQNKFFYEARKLKTVFATNSNVLNSFKFSI